MTVPSYDDLTPGIPGITDAETAGNLASLLREPRPAAGSRLPAAGSRLPASGSRLSASGSRLPAVYACVRLAAGSRQLHAVLAVACDFSPRVRCVSDREVVLDVSGLGRLIGPPPEIERQLAHALLSCPLTPDARVAATVAIAPTQTIARLLAHAGETGHGHTFRHRGHTDREDHTTAACDLCDLRGLCAGACGRGPWQQLPVELLRELEVLPPGINHRDRARPYETLQRWGIATLGELAALPAADLSSRLGRRGVALQRLARGLDAAPFVPDAATPRYVERLELEWPVDGLEPLSFVLARLLDPLAAALERADRGAVAIHVDLRLTDRSTHTRVLPLPAAMRDARVLRTLVLLDLESHPPAPLRGFAETGAATAAIDVVTIELDPAPSRITQFSLLQRALPSPETLSTLVARLSALAGESRVGSPVLVDSHAPDAFVMERYAPACAAAPLRRGEPGDRCEAVIRRQRPPVAIHVSVDRGRPAHIAASKRGIPYGAITQAAGPWRTSGHWWTASGAESAAAAEQLRRDLAEARARSEARQGGGRGQGNGAWNRDEWDVALKSGAVCRVYRDRTTARWFLEGIYD